MYFVICGVVFLTAYLLNVLTITIGYHRGLAHKALTLHPVLKKVILVGGNWLTGIDPKGWVVMHRMHHEHSDGPNDPHSPLNVGFFGIGLAQLRGYKQAIIGLLKQKPKYLKYAKDLDFDLSPLNRTQRWYLPYLMHVAIGLLLAVSVGWLLGLAYFAGMMSHPVQGGIVNFFGHAIGGRNFELDDNSRNNHFAAWLIMGEGFQNNHHRYPASASFSYRRSEVDLGFVVCRALDAMGLVKIKREALIPRPPRVGSQNNGLLPS